MWSHVEGRKWLGVSVELMEDRSSPDTRKLDA
jgi:hypothetical protein